VSRPTNALPGLDHFRLGVRVIFSPWLGTARPTFERERFSGGVNESARERNAKKRSVYHLTREGTVIVPEWMRPEIEAAFADLESDQ
jgi:hypothetical protein